MSTKLLSIAMLISNFTLAQSYNDLIKQASDALQTEDYQNAYSIFLKAFQDNSSIGIYDLTSAAFSATKMNDKAQAIIWLELSVEKGLGKNKEELEYILNDSIYSSLHQEIRWKNIVININSNYLKEQQKLKADSMKWANELKRNRIKINNPTNNSIEPGFALYFNKVDNIEVPYLVFIPSAYSTSNKTKAIVFLHGGVVNADSFNYKNPEIAKEPIFEVAESLNILIIYPFAKKDFGWVNQVKAFENVLGIIRNVQNLYSIDESQIYLGGMSNGGTAAFWYASKKPNIFKGFYAISAIPKLNIGEINFNNLSQGKPFYSLHDRNDQVFKFEDVESIYLKERSKAKDWYFESISDIGHGFIYKPDHGNRILEEFILKMLKSN